MIVGSSGPARSSPLEQGIAQIGGRVSPCVWLSLGQGWQQKAAGTELLVNVVGSGLESLQVELSGTAPSTGLQIAVPLEIRTNVAYEMKLVVLSSDGCAPDIVAAVGAIRPSGALVSPGAAEASSKTESLGLMRCVSPAIALRGARVSARGNFSTPGNALLANLDLSIPPIQQPCYWRVVFQISLHPSS